MYDNLPPGFNCDPEEIYDQEEMEYEEYRDSTL